MAQTEVYHHPGTASNKFELDGVCGNDSQKVGEKKVLATYTDNLQANEELAAKHSSGSYHYIT